MALGADLGAPLNRAGEVQTTGSRVTPPFFVKASRVTNTTTLAAQALQGAITITVADDTDILVGDYLGLFCVTSNRFYVGTVLEKLGANVLDLDTPLDSQFEVGDVVGTGVTNLASIDGTRADPAVYSIRGADPGLAVTVSITRIVISCLTATKVDLLKFGDLPKLTNGLVVLREDGTTFNHINWKDNREIAGAMFDWTPFAADNPVQGVDGFISRLTYADESKLGTFIELGPGENLKFKVQDPLFTDGLGLLEVMVEGNVRPV